MRTAKIDYGIVWRSVSGYGMVVLMMDDVTGNAAPSEEVRRRLRLARVDTSTAVVGPYPDDDFDAVVLVSDRDPETAARIRSLCADLRVKVVSEAWRRS